MYVLRLGILSFLLSECLVSGFTTGAAIHVFSSQIKDLLGLELPRVKGYFKLIKVKPVSCISDIVHDFSSLVLDLH
jgi:solute carrier family 26, other